MSAKIPYDPALFTVRRWTSATSKLSGFKVGRSKLNRSPSAWVPIEAATVTLSYGYSPDMTGVPKAVPPVPPGTLLVDAETATISLSFWDEPGPLLYAGDHIDVRYDNKILFNGYVDSTSLTYAVDPAAAAHGATRRVDFTATAAGLYAVQMARIITWTKLPKEFHITRIRRWCQVDNWS